MKNKRATGRVKKKRISILINAVYYKFMQVMVIEDKDHFRLLVINPQVQVIEDKEFHTLQEAQTYFEDNFTMLASAVALDELPAWSTLYYPESNWLNKLLRSCVNINQVGRVSGKHSGKSQAAPYLFFVE
jgi:hypothetical protein